jgi:hypothetical protein
MMKKLFLVSLIVFFIVLSTTAYATEKASLGNFNLAIKLDYINFTKDALKNSDIDTGLYTGLEGYGKIAPNLYLGAEVGYANPEGTALGLDTKLNFIPIEMNLKYIVEAAPNLNVDFGIGISYNYVEEKASGIGVSVSLDDWVFGGQLFADLNYRIDTVFIGINAKYQITENSDIGGTESDRSFSNWRIGGQAGIMF